MGVKEGEGGGGGSEAGLKGGRRVEEGEGGWRGGIEGVAKQ